MSGLFEGQAAIVTGGAGGIGLAVARRLVEEGADVALVDRHRGQADEAALSLAAGGARTIALAADVRIEADVETMRDRVLERFGRIDILVACAGILRGVPGRPQTVAETAPEAWDLVIDTNLTGVFLSNRAVIPAMVRQGRGQIVNLSSTSGRRGLAFDAAYCASKFGVIGLSESLADELRPHGIRVHAVLPEVVDTPMLEQNGPLFRPKEMLAADRVADFIVYLLGLPDDTAMLSPVIAPFRSRARGSSMGREA